MIEYDWILISLLALFCGVALAFIIHPFKENWRYSCVLVPVVLGICWFGYSYWGGWSQWHRYHLEQVRKQKAKQLLATIKSPQELIDRLLSRLAGDPNNARGWFYLGRLYSSQNQWENARMAFEKAYRLNSNEPEIVINYAEILLSQQKGQFSNQIRSLLHQLLKQHPQQPDALALLATDAYQHKHYARAKAYWTRLLALVPAHSKEANALRQALAAIKSKENSSEEKRIKNKEKLK